MDVIYEFNPGHWTVVASSTTFFKGTEAETKHMGYFAKSYANVPKRVRWALALPHSKLTSIDAYYMDVVVNATGGYTPEAWNNRVVKKLGSHGWEIVGPDEKDRITEEISRICGKVLPQWHGVNFPQRKEVIECSR